MSSCPHCQTAIPAQAVRCFQCKKWVNQLSSAAFLNQYVQAISKNWPVYLGLSLFFLGIVVAISLKTLNFHWAETLRFAFGHWLRASLWFAAISVFTYLWVRPLAIRTNQRLIPTVSVALIIIFSVCHYAESWSVPQFLRYYNTKQETLSQIHLRERVNRQEWFGQTKRQTPFNPLPKGKKTLQISVNNRLGTFGINPQLQHSVIFSRFVSKHLLEVPPNANDLQAGLERWSPVYLNWTVAKHPAVTNVLTWVQTDGPDSTPALDGIIGQDILAQLPALKDGP
jgi:hypothetical protein